MKKWLIFLLTLCLCLSVASCGTTGGNSSENSNNSSETTENKKPASHVQIKGITLSLGAEFTEEDRTALGEPDDVMEAPSCHYDGSDSIYYYPGFTLYTYMSEEKAILYSIELSDASLSTPEGIKVGMTLDEVKAQCGSDFKETETGISYALDEGIDLNFRAEAGIVTVIEYYTE